MGRVAFTRLDTICDGQSDRHRGTDRRTHWENNMSSDPEGGDIIMVLSGDAFVITYFRLLLLQLSLWVFF